jgi:SAM-dependent methyltransferase
MANSDAPKGSYEGSTSDAAMTAYEHLGDELAEHDPRDQYTYMYSKFRSDYTLMESVGVEGKSVLNIGCSFPIDEIYYARKVGSWTAIDLSPTSLKAAEEIVKRELHPDLASKFSFREADACDLPFENDTFDMSVSMSTIDQIPSREAHQKSVDEMARTTKPGGHVVVTVANRWCLPYAAGIRKMTREDTLHYGFAYLFSPVEIRNIGLRAGLKPIAFASSICPPDVWLGGYPRYVRWPATLEFKLHRAAGYLGRRVGYVFEKPGRPAA